MSSTASLDPSSTSPPLTPPNPQRTPLSPGNSPSNNRLQ
uniref:Uncharacterized protein n=1 Tax=Rhizophora mucronata TaxID=61149 RepID=A0A2P2J8H8_RHIMU